MENATIIYPRSTLDVEEINLKQADAGPPHDFSVFRRNGSSLVCGAGNLACSRLLAGRDQDK
jgi:hypothetical protein